jgi:hypothetical protein
VLDDLIRAACDGPSSSSSMEPAGSTARLRPYGTPCRCGGARCTSTGTYCTRARAPARSQPVPLPKAGRGPTSPAMLRTRLTPAGFVRPCQPSPVTAPPAGSGWWHEIKHDGHRLMVRREGERVRAFTRNGNDWGGALPGHCGGRGWTAAPLVPDRRRGGGGGRRRLVIELVRSQAKPAPVCAATDRCWQEARR